MSKRVAKDKHDRTALDVIYDVDAKKYKLVTIKYSLEHDSALVYSMEDLSESMAVTIMKFNIINDRRIQNAIEFAKEKAKNNKEDKDSGQDEI
jgi:hypothetical protein